MKLNCPECWRRLVRAVEMDGYVCPTRYRRRRPGPDEGSYIEVGFKSPCEDVFVGALSLIEPGPPREPIEDRWYSVEAGGLAFG